MFNRPINHGTIFLFLYIIILHYLMNNENKHYLSNFLVLSLFANIQSNICSWNYPFCHSSIIPHGTKIYQTEKYCPRPVRHNIWFWNVGLHHLNTMNFVSPARIKFGGIHCQRSRRVGGSFNSRAQTCDISRSGEKTKQDRDD